ncbi:MAG: D-sedoheptulose 7-phosphate isomerase [Actinomycetota bacterium]|nr:D-sedoheptulose 7-phosphate isomerase [Actinomycetota bacterium]
MSNSVEVVKSALAEGIRARQEVLDKHIAPLVEIGKICGGAIENGNKILLCGNGGSAADAQHLAAELLIRLRPDVTRQTLPAIALAMDTSTLTACGNDLGFEVIFERMVEALGNRGDVLIGITTSGKSPNILKALTKAKELGIVTVGFLGGSGGPALPLCDYSFIAPTSITGRIQELHITAGHIVMELVEDYLIEKGKLKIVK